MIVHIAQRFTLALDSSFQVNGTSPEMQTLAWVIENSDQFPVVHV